MRNLFPRFENHIKRRFRHSSTVGKAPRPYRFLQEFLPGLRSNFPQINVQADKVLVESGDDLRLIRSGSHATWYDLLLYVISRTSGRQAALHTAKFFLLQWHTDGQSPYMAFRENLKHGNAAIRKA